MATSDQNLNEHTMTMSTPRVFIFRMVLFLLLVGLVAVLVSEPLIRAFQGNLVINSLILGVLVLGCFYCIARVASLWQEVKWVNTFRKGEPDVDTPGRTALLAPMAAMLKDRSGPVALSATSTRVILDSIGARLDEGRETTRYVANLLIFLGILGTFWGLLQSTGAIQGALNSLSAGASSPEAALEDLQAGLAGPLAGMDTAFSSSLFGIAGSLILGFLGLQASQAQNRFYNEFEEWLSTITYISSGSPIASEGGAGVSPDMMHALDATIRQVDALRQAIEKSEEARASTEQWLVQTTQNLSTLDEVVRSQRDAMGSMTTLAKEQAVSADERHREMSQLFQAIAANTHHLAEHGTGSAPAAPAAGQEGAPVANTAGLQADIRELLAHSQQSDERISKTLLSLREIAARILQYAERGTADQTLQSVQQLNETTTRLLAAASQAASGTPQQPMPAGTAPAPASAPADSALLQQLNDRIGQLVQRADQAKEEGIDKASLATLRSLDKTAAKLLQAAEDLSKQGPAGDTKDLQAYLQELVTHARGSVDREMLEALKSINAIAHSMRETAEEGRTELMKELRAEMKVLTKTIAALIIESRRNDGPVSGGRR